MEVDGRTPEWAARLLDLVERPPGQRLVDANLRSMGIDPTRARRYFRAHFGMTFQAYRRARRMGLALAQLRRGGDLLQTGLAHGYESSSGFREAFRRLFGQPPGRGRTAACVVVNWLTSPIGPLVVAASDGGVCLIEFLDRRALQTQLARLRKRLGCALVPGNNRHIETLRDELRRYFDGSLTDFTVPLAIAGTSFQEAVWKHLLKIPFGETMSYEALARQIGRPAAQRAVGRANGENRLAIVVPCHRVVQKDGSLRGYGGGLWRKQFLLDHERSVCQRRLAKDAATARSVGYGTAGTLRPGK